MFITEHRCHLYRTDVVMGENRGLTVNKKRQTVHQSYNKTVSRTLFKFPIGMLNNQFLQYC